MTVKAVVQQETSSYFLILIGVVVDFHLRQQCHLYLRWTRFRSCLGTGVGTRTDTVDD